MLWRDWKAHLKDIIQGLLCMRVVNATAVLTMRLINYTCIIILMRWLANGAVSNLRAMSTLFSVAWSVIHDSDLLFCTCHLLILEKKKLYGNLQLGNAGLPDSRGDGLDSSLNANQELCQIAGGMRHSLLLPQREPRQRHGVCVNCLACGSHLEGRWRRFR